MYPEKNMVWLWRSPHLLLRELTKLDFLNLSWYWAIWIGDMCPHKETLIWLDYEFSENPPNSITKFWIYACVRMWVFLRIYAQTVLNYVVYGFFSWIYVETIFKLRVLSSPNSFISLNVFFIILYLMSVVHGKLFGWQSMGMVTLNWIWILVLHDYTINQN